MSSLEADPSPSLQRRLLWRLTLGIGLLLGTLFVALAALIAIVLTAVQFDRQFVFVAVEI